MPVRKPITIAAGIALFVAALGVGYLAGRLAADDGEAPPVGAVGTPTPVAPPADPTPGVTPRPPQLPIIPEVGGFDPVTGLPMDPDRTVPFWSSRYSEAERMLRPFEGEVAGVYITPHEDPARPRLRECPSGKFSWPDDLAAIAGTPIALPARPAMEGVGDAWHVQIVFCDGQPLAANASYTLATDIQKGRYGAGFIVSRFHPGDEKRPVVVLTKPAQRLEVREVAGAPAAVFAPVLPHIGVTLGAVVTYRDGVVTVVQGDSSLADLIAFTEAILR